MSSWRVCAAVNLTVMFTEHVLGISRLMYHHHHHHLLKVAICNQT